jgi:hypothetical protein
VHSACSSSGRQFSNPGSQSALYIVQEDQAEAGRSPVSTGHQVVQQSGVTEYIVPVCQTEAGRSPVLLDVR